MGGRGNLFRPLHLYTSCCHLRLQVCAQPCDECWSSRRSDQHKQLPRAWFLIIDCEFRENIASSGLGGALSLNESPYLYDVKLIRSQFVSNIATTGGAVNVMDGRVAGTTIETISECYFYDNQCIAPGHVKSGGAISNQGGIIKALEDCVFEANFAGDPIGRGDDIFSSSGSLLVLRNTEFRTPEVWTETFLKFRDPGYLVTLLNVTSRSTSPFVQIPAKRALTKKVQQKQGATWGPTV